MEEKKERKKRVHSDYVTQVAVADDITRGVPRKEVAEKYGISESSVTRYCRLMCGDDAVKKQYGPRDPELTRRAVQRLRELNGDVARVCEELGTTAGAVRSWGKQFCPEVKLQSAPHKYYRLDRSEKPAEVRAPTRAGPLSNLPAAVTLARYELRAPARRRWLAGLWAKFVAFVALGRAG